MIQVDSGFRVSAIDRRKENCLLLNEIRSICKIVKNLIITYLCFKNGSCVDSDKIIVLSPSVAYFQFK